MDLFERSEQRWTEVYLYGEAPRFNRNGQAGIDLGRKMADGLESGELTGDVLLDLTIVQIPKLEVMEMELRAELKRGAGVEPVPLLGKLDTASKDLTAFKEYKQGTERWTQTKVDKWGQITFYATMIYILTGKIPEDIELVWMPTERVDGMRNEATGDICRFRTRRRLPEILNMMVRQKQAWEGMERVTDQFLWRQTSKKQASKRITTK